MKNPIRRLIHRYTYDMRLKTKLVISHIILILLPTAVLSGFFFLRIYDIVMKDSIRSEQVLSAQTVNSLENLISHVSSSSDTITNSLFVQDVFRIPIEDAKDKTISSSRMSSLFHLARSITDASLITDVKIYYDDQAYGDLQQYNQLNQALFQPMSTISSSYWYGIYSTSHSTSLLCPELYLSPSEAEKNGRLAYITRIPYSDSEPAIDSSRSASAYIAVYFSRTSFDNVLSKDATVMDEAAFIINSRDVIVSASDMALAGMYYMPHSEFSSRMGTEKEFSLVSFMDSSAYAAYFPIKDTDWIMVSVIPALHITDAGRDMMTHFALIYLFFTAIAMYISFQLSGSIADRIITVALQMEKVRTGRPQPLDIGDTGCDEIGVLADTYNYMTEEIGLLMDSQKEAADNLRRAEFRALQAQINPHFLYNTLDMINWLSQTGRNQEVTQAIQALSRFYKLTLSRNGLMNSIETELQHVSLYIRLQNMRYDNCVTFVMDVPDELYDYTIPKLTFQPIVENAFLHGIMTTEQKKGSILLTGWKSGDDIGFIISDDGAGIPPEKLDTLMHDMVHAHMDAGVKQQASPGHIGIYNTNLRLKSLYGEMYGLSFTSTLGKGPEVTVRIPARHITGSLEQV